MATKPKSVSKRTASVRVTKKKRGISKLQALAIAGVLALIGVVAVVLTHASGTPNYQYSWSKYCVAAQGSSNVADVKKCKELSAEAMVYRLYRGLYDKSPDDGGYKFWTQKLAGDRVKVTETDLVVGRVDKMGSDTTFVKSLYTDMLMRTPTQKEVDQWVGRLKAEGNKKWSRQKVAYQFAISGEAIRKNDSRWTKFVASAPTVTVIQTAAQSQKKRFNAILADYQQPAKVDMDKAAKLVIKAQASMEAANAIANKANGTVTADDLEAVGEAQTRAQAYYDQAKLYADDASTKQQAASNLLEQSEELAKYADDIRDNSVYGIEKITDRYNKTKFYAAAALGSANTITVKINAISDAYARAAKKIAIKVPLSTSTCTSDCVPPAGPGKTTAELDIYYRDKCNAAPDKRSTLKGVLTGIENASSVDIISDVFYTQTFFHPHNRSCDLRFKQYVSGTLRCVGGYSPSGLSCKKDVGIIGQIGGNQSNQPILGSIGIDKGKQCPKGYFPAQGYCWNGVAAAGPYNIDERFTCPKGTKEYNSLKTGILLITCRTRKAQYAGY